MRTQEGRQNMKDWQTFVRRHVARTPPKLLHSIYESIPRCSKPREPSARSTATRWPSKPSNGHMIYPVKNEGVNSIRSDLTG